VFTWGTRDKPKSKLFKSGVRELKSLKGRPSFREGRTIGWVDDEHQYLWFESDESNTTSLMVTCIETDGQYWEAMEAAGAEAPADRAVTLNENTVYPINPWLDRSLVGVLLDFGQPVEPPFVLGENIIGLHYRQAMGSDGQPAEFWWWFLDGKAVYVAAEALPPSGSNKAWKSYNSLRDIFRKTFGPPTESGRDEETGIHRVLYVNGPQRIIGALVDPEGDPWIRIEIYDTEHLDELGPDLRPGRNLPKRYEPPRRDTGLTREDLEGVVGSG
jgi:hypothetical protein